MGFFSDLFGGKTKSDTRTSAESTQTENLSRDVQEQRSALETQLGLSREQVDEAVRAFEQLTSEQQQQELANMSEQERQLLSEAQKSREVSTQRVEKDVEAFKNIPVSSSSELELHLGRAVELGELQPQQAEAILQERTQLENLQPDPALERVQADTLVQLQSLATTGDTAESRAARAKVFDNSVQQARASRERVKQEFAERGMSGAGTELVSQLAAEDQGARTRSEQEFETLRQQEERRRQAISDLALEAGKQREQEFGEGVTKAEAQDRINAFNTTNLMQTELANLEQKSKTQQLNLDEQRRAQELNLQLEREEAVRKSQIPEIQFEQGFKKAAGVSGAYSGAGTTTNVTETEQQRQQQADTTSEQQKQAQTTTAEQQQSAQQQQKTGTTTGTQVAVGQADETGSQQIDQTGTTTGKSTGASSTVNRDASKGLDAVGKIVGMVGGLFSDVRMKEDITPMTDEDVDRFLDEVTGYKYRYKRGAQDQGLGSPGQKMGPMAQDLENTELASAVHDTPNGKMVDAREVTMALTAIVRNLGERVRQLEGQQ